MSGLTGWAPCTGWAIDITEAFTRVDACLARRWKLQGHPVELAMVRQNLGGEHYEEFRDINLFDRRAYLSLMHDW